jgi:hypothetical protein
MGHADSFLIMEEDQLLGFTGGKNMHRKQWAGAALVAVVLLLAGAIPGQAFSGSAGGSRWNAPHSGFHHPGFDRPRGHGFIGARVFIGDPFWWEPPIAYSPPVYVQPAPTAYWYYCQNPQGYYPYVQQCPAGWMTVIPPP